MKPANFEYFDPTTVEEVVGLTGQYGFDAKILAGGQSLVPLLNFRLATPAVIIDINRVVGLDYVKEVKGRLAIGALARQRVLETSDLIRSKCGLLADTAELVGHPQIRNRGTICGSICHADPAAELPAVARLLDAQIKVVGPGGARTVPAGEFFVTLMTTCLDPTEVVTEVSFPVLAPKSGWAFEEFTMRHGDFAIVGVAALITLNAQKVCSEARVVAIGVAETPYRDANVEQLLTGQKLTDSLSQEAGKVMAAGAEPSADLHASAAQRKHLLQAMTGKVVQKAAARALANSK